MRREVSVAASTLAALEEGQFLRVPLPTPAWMPNGALVTSVIVGRAGGALRAYANVCMHHPVPLDQDAPTVMAVDGYHLCCHQHGAMYRPTDGLCVDGPCRGERLFPAAIEQGPASVTLVLDG